MFRLITLCVMGLTLMASTPSAVLGDDFGLDWYTFDGGGQMWSAGGEYKLGGTIGQPDANAIVMTGGEYKVRGGF